jgi:hypothetical protein
MQTTDLKMDFEKYAGYSNFTASSFDVYDTNSTYAYSYEDYYSRFWNVTPGYSNDR